MSGAPIGNLKGNGETEELPDNNALALRIDELERKMFEMEQDFEYLPQEIDDKINDEIGTNDLLESLFDVTKGNVDAINAILTHIEKKEKVTVWKVLASLSTLRGLIGIP